MMSKICWMMIGASPSEGSSSSNSRGCGDLSFLTGTSQEGRGVLGVRVSDLQCAQQRSAAVRHLQALTHVFGTSAAGAARGVELRHDHGSQYLTDYFQSNARFHGFTPSFALLGEPETNGVVERFHRTLADGAGRLACYDAIALAAPARL